MKLENLEAARWNTAGSLITSSIKKIISETEK